MLTSCQNCISVFDLIRISSNLVSGGNMNLALSSALENVSDMMSNFFLRVTELLLNIGVKPLMKHSTLMIFLTPGKSQAFQKMLRSALQLKDLLIFVRNFFLRLEFGDVCMQQFQQLRQLSKYSIIIFINIYIGVYISSIF